ncbi:uncharacterized protein LOC143239579 [Tachypleus tridentatus]|uniref:uncharacterized protein LOC143239579 n=1 Tax=Tachypleus tridentatus TaxID=6853 RepID=UPI003FD3D489
MRSMKTSVSHHTTRFLTLSFRENKEYGMLFCWAENQVGRQKIPCKYKISPGGLPESLTNCTITNKTKETLAVRCLEGFDGGLAQHFRIEVFTEEKGRLVANISSTDVPFFFITSLPSGSTFILVIYAINSLGRSPLVTLRATTLGEEPTLKEKATEMPTVQLPLIMGLIFGVLIVLIVLILTKVLLKHYRSQRLEYRDVKGKERTQKKLHSLIDDESPKHDAQFLDLISTKHDFSGPPDVTHISSSWTRSLVVEFHPKNFSDEVILRMDRKPLFTPSGTIRWREDERLRNEGVSDEGVASTFALTENSDFLNEKCDLKEVEMSSLPKVKDDGNGTTIETSLKSDLQKTDQRPKQSSVEHHILSTAV